MGLGLAMKIGMLWFDADPKRDLADKIRRAAAYYHQKYSRAATVCQISLAEALAEAAIPEAVDGISVRTSALVLAHHLWLGIEEA